MLDPCFRDDGRELFDPRPRKDDCNIFQRKFIVGGIRKKKKNDSINIDLVKFAIFIKEQGARVLL